MYNKKKLLIVDDVEVNRGILAEAFHNEYDILEAENGQEAWEIILAHRNNIAAVLLDLVMPVMDGVGVLERMTEHQLMEHIPVFLITAETLDDTLMRIYEMGVVDIIGKPFNPFFIRRRLSNIIELFQRREYLQEMVQEQMEKLDKQAKELRESNYSIIETLSTAIEFRDCESGEHVKRIRNLTSLFLTEIAAEHQEFGLDPEKIQLISEAAVMHDVGKISIPDYILNKPGKLTKQEFETMKEHTIRGCQLLDSVASLRNSEIYKYAYDICRHHHERWDGNGYPDHLKGDEISIWSQAVSLADVYDALVNERVYKRAYSREQAIHMIFNGECGIFNPLILDCFTRVKDKIDQKVYA